MADTDKNKLLRELYYDEDDGFMSSSNLYKDAHAKDPSITAKYVSDWLNKQSSIQTHKKGKLWNSYIADHPLQQVAVDLADYNKSKHFNDGFSYIWVGVDYFTKFVFAKALKDKKSPELTEALKDMIKEMGQIEAVVSDFEGGTQSPLFIKVLNEHKIRHIITSTPNGQAERTIKTIKDLIHTRITGLNLPNERWIDLLPKVVKYYNEKHVHNTIGMSPKMALNKDNHLQVLINIRKKAQFKKAYGNLRVGDLVRTAIKKYSFTKGYSPKFSSDTFKITFVKVNADGTRDYLLNTNTRKLYQQHELRRVDAVETKDTVDE